MFITWLEKGNVAIHRNPRSYTRRSMFDKRGFFQRISAPFCEVKRGFVDP
jgi:hypothetical protein